MLAWQIVTKLKLPVYFWSQHLFKGYSADCYEEELSRQRVSRQVSFGGEFSKISLQWIDWTTDEIQHRVPWRKLRDKRWGKDTMQIQGLVKYNSDSGLSHENWLPRKYAAKDKLLMMVLKKGSWWGRMRHRCACRRRPDSAQENFWYLLRTDLWLRAHSSITARH